jgi:hypothetical protein
MTAPEGPKALEIYLNDHLAGATSALALMEDVVENTSDEQLRRFVTRLHDEVREDVRELETIIERIGVGRERMKQALADVAESLSRVKLGRAGAPNELSRLLELEAISTGIWGKMRLWRSLQEADVLAGALAAEVDLDELVGRAQRQLDEVETHRLRAARAALGS